MIASPGASEPFGRTSSPSKEPANRGLPMSLARRILPIVVHLQSRLRVRVDCPIPFSPSIYVLLGESREKRACARDLRSCTDPENVSGGSNRKNSAKPIPARNWQVHRRGGRDRNDLPRQGSLRPPSRFFCRGCEESLPSSRRQSNECSRRQGHQVLAREGDTA